jgi:SH3-like domain-containing protein
MSIAPIRLAPAALAALATLATPGLGGEQGTRGAVTNLPLPRFVSMRAESANARRGPSLNHRVDWAFVHRGQPLEVTAEYGHWRRVRDADGAGGWVHHSLLSGVRTVEVRTEGMTPLRAAAAENTALRAYLEPGVVAELEECHGGWCRIEADGIGGWIARAALWGVGPEDGE